MIYYATKHNYEIYIITAKPVAIIYHIKNFILSVEDFKNKFGIDNKAMSNIKIENIGKDISLTPIEIIMRDQKPETIHDPELNIIVIPHPTDCTHWVSVIRREGGPVYYFDSFGVETPPLFLEEYVNLGSSERIQQYDES